MTLEVLISTLGPEGIRRVVEMRLPRVDGVSYIVSWQMPQGEIPRELERPDVKVFPLEGRGVSRNRNNCLDHASADILLIADDDLQYTPERLRAVIDAFELRPDLDMAVFRYEGPDTSVYPAEECSLTERMPKGLYVASFQMAVRRESPAGKLRFSELFGMGAPEFLSGEDEFYLLTARSKRLNIRFFPITITVHAGLTTGHRRQLPGNITASGALIRRQYPQTWPLRLLLKALRLTRASLSPVSLGKTLLLLLRGARRSPRLF